MSEVSKPKSDTLSREELEEELISAFSFYISFDVLSKEGSRKANLAREKLNTLLEENEKLRREIEVLKLQIDNPGGLL